MREREKRKRKGKRTGKKRKRKGKEKEKKKEDCSFHSGLQSTNPGKQLYHELVLLNPVQFSSGIHLYESAVRN